MPIQRALDDLRQRHPRCLTVAFVDLSSGLVLCHSEAEKTPQERLDALCRAAQAALTGSPLEAPTAADRPGTARLALEAEPAATRLYLRSASDPSDALCAVCAPDIDMDSFLQSALSSLHEISDPS